MTNFVEIDIDIETSFSRRNQPNKQQCQQHQKLDWWYVASSYSVLPYVDRAIDCWSAPVYYITIVQCVSKSVSSYLLMEQTHHSCIK